MDRNVVTESEGAARRATLGDGTGDVPDQLNADHYMGRLIKYIPAEVIGAHVAAQSASGTLPAHPTIIYSLGPNMLLSWVAFAAVAIVAPFYLKYVANISKTWQIIICEFAFVAWAAGLEGTPFHWDAGYRSLVVLCATFVLPIFKLEWFPVKETVLATES